MAMVVKNNMSAVSTLNTLNKNNSALAKSLQKVSSGMKINGAEDDASAYSISKRMEVRTRALDQDIQNSKTGRNLVKTAEGGIQEIINNIRDMKAMAINASNDHNTDADRATIQKEFSQRMSTITDIAATTNYNGRLLLNGSYSEPSERIETIMVPHYTTKTYQVGPPSVTYIQNPNGTYTIRQDNAVSNLASAFSPAYNTCTALSNPQYGSPYSGQKDCDYGFQHDNNSSWNWVSATGSTAATTQNNQIAVQVDFSGVTANSGTVSIPSDLNNQGFTIVCGLCDQYINIKFDASTTASTYTRTNSDVSEYVIGVSSATTWDDVNDALFNGIATAPFNSRASYYSSYIDLDNADNVVIDGNHQVRMAKDPSGTGYLFLKASSPPLCFLDQGTILGTVTSPSAGSTTVLINGPTTITETEVTYTEKEETIYYPGNPLIIHTGAKQNENMPVFINSMHPNAIRWPDAEGKEHALSEARVNTYDQAQAAIDIVDGALQYALNENTRMGAYQYRLEHTEDNLVTANENTVSSMSKIRDADMAKEMENYTKNNVLSQAAQSMLGQANQNSSGILSLLQ